MAEYFPLIDRAIAGLPESTAEARRSIYERARGALIGQLRKTEPPVPEEDIARESAALDEAIARVEAKFADHGAARAPAGAGAPPPRIAPPPPAGSASAPVAGRNPRLAARLATSAPTAAAPAEPAPAAQRRPATGAPGLPTGKAPPVVPPPVRERPVIGPAPTVASEPRPAIAPARPLAANRAGRPTLPLRPEATEAAGPAPLARRGGAVETSDPSAPALPPAPDLAVTRSGLELGSFESVVDDTSAGDADSGVEAPTPPSPATRFRDPALRPAAPGPTPPRRFGWQAALLLALVALVMIGVGIAAWMLRDRPDQLAATHPIAAAPDTPEPGKIVGRAAPGQDAPPDGSSSGVAVPAPVGQGGGDDAGAAIPVAQRAALLVDAPDDPQKLKTYSGTVVWHLDSVSPGQGLPLALAVKADIDIPDAQLKVTMVMQKNPEPQLPASHTIELHFLPQPGYTLGNVLQINMPDLRKDNAPAGDALAGVPVTIDPNNFLVGLSRGGAETQNKRLVTERNWFDVGVLLAPQRPAKLTFEKGADGERLWEQAFAAWGDAKGASATAP